MAHGDAHPLRGWTSAGVDGEAGSERFGLAGDSSLGGPNQIRTLNWKTNKGVKKIRHILWTR